MPSETMSQWRYREHVTKSLSGMGFKFHFLQSLEINVRFTCLAPNSPVLPGTSFSKHDSSSLFHTLPIHVLCTPLFMNGTRFPMVRILEDEPVLITLFDKVAVRARGTIAGPPIRGKPTRLASGLLSCPWPCGSHWLFCGTGCCEAGDWEKRYEFVWALDSDIDLSKAGHYSLVVCVSSNRVVLPLFAF